MAESEPPLALGPIDFSTHVLSLASSAMIALGRMPAPGSAVSAMRPCMTMPIVEARQRIVHMRA